MQITIQGKQMDVGDALRTHVNEKLAEINSKYFNHATDGTVTFSKEGHGHGLTRTHIAIRVGKNISVVAEAAENEPYLSFEVASNKVAKQLRRYKRRLRDHNERIDRTEGAKVPYYVIAENARDEDETEAMPQGDDPVTVAEMVTHIDKLSVSDAVMRLDLGNQTALLFRNAKHGELNLVYRRPDGNIGWIDPSTAMAQAAE